jgi:uncharacterized protein (TIRG00374 family)
MRLSKLFPLIGLLIFVYIIFTTDLQKVASIIVGANPLLLVASMALSLPIVALKGYKWRVLVKAYDVEYGVLDATKAWLMGFSLSMVTPARVGDLSRAYYLKGKTTTGKALTTVIIDRIIDMFILFVLAIAGILGFFTLFSSHLNMLTTFFTLFLLFLAGVYLFTRGWFIRPFMQKVFYRLVPNRHKSRISITFDDFYKGMEGFRKKKSIVSLAVSMAIPVWIISVFQIYTISLAIGLNISYLFLFSVVPVMALLDTLPISFSGIGTREAALIFFLSFVSAQQYAVPFSLLILFIGYLVPGVAGAALISRSRG